MSQTPIWFATPDLSIFAATKARTICEVIDINITEIGDDYLVGTMPADKRTHQIAGIVHGGANVVLAETLGSVGAYLTVDPEQFVCVGQEVSASHLRGVKEGLVTAIARPVHRGSTTQVWQIDVTDEQQRLTCVSRLTVAIRPKRSE